MGYLRLPDWLRPLVSFEEFEEDAVAEITGPDPLRFHAVLTEGALRLEVGGPEVMAAQLERLLAAASSGNTSPIPR